MRKERRVQETDGDPQRETKSGRHRGNVVRSQRSRGAGHRMMKVMGHLNAYEGAWTWTWDMSSSSRRQKMRADR